MKAAMTYEHNCLFILPLLLGGGFFFIVRGSHVSAGLFFFFSCCTPQGKTHSKRIIFSPVEGRAKQDRVDRGFHLPFLRRATHLYRGRKLQLFVVVVVGQDLWPFAVDRGGKQWRRA